MSQFTDKGMTAADLAMLRLSLGLTQAQMAETIGLSRRAYIDLENGTSTIRKLHQLAIERAFIRSVAANSSIAGIGAIDQRVLDDVSKAAEVINAAHHDDRTHVPMFTAE
jgi:DNA-binding XRE family transcriptional regulator